MNYCCVIHVVVQRFCCTNLQSSFPVLDQVYLVFFATLAGCGGLAVVTYWLRLNCGALLAAGSGIFCTSCWLRQLGCGTLMVAAWLWCLGLGLAAVAPFLGLLWCLGFNLAATAVVPWTVVPYWLLLA